MGNYEQLKQSVSDVIKTNGNQEITGSILQNVLLTIISAVGANATFAGIATPTTNPGTPDGPVFWLASEGGTYSNFNAIELQDGLSVLMWNGSWNSQQIFGVDDVPTAGSDNLVRSGGVAEELALGAVYDVSAKNPTAGVNNDGKFESLSALLGDANLNTLIPTAVRKGGMSIKFVQSSDNKYVQYRLTADEFTTDITQWLNEDSIITKPTGNTSDLELSDENNNILVRFKNGGIKTKNFDSGTTPIIGDSDDADLIFTDDKGNVLVKFRGGHIQTKNFDSLNNIQSDFIGIASACRYDGKLMHISFDDTNSCLTTLFGSTHSSIYDVSFFSQLKNLHETYGACFSCYVYSSALESVTNAYASEFQAAKNWLKFNFHSLNASKTYGTGTPIADDYNLCITRLLTMVGNDLDCLDHQMRANYWELSLDNAIAVRDNSIHASYIFCAKDPFSPSPGNYYLDTNQKKVVFANSLYFDVANEVVFIQTCARLDDDAKIADSKTYITSNIKWQKTCEVLNHEWGFNATKMGNFLDWAKNTMGFKFGFFSDIFVIK